MVHPLNLMNFSGTFDLASGGFMAAPHWISNCSDLFIGTLGRPWRLESYSELGTKRSLCLKIPQGPVGHCLHSGFLFVLREGSIL